MANEIYHSGDEANSFYALIWRKSDNKIWNDTDSQFDTYTDVDIDKYDIPLNNQVDSDYHSVDFPSAIGEGTYRAQVMFQVGGSLDADADLPNAQAEIQWSGTAELDIFTIFAQGSRVTNEYGPGE